MQNTIEFSADRVKLKTIDEQLYDHVVEYGPVPSDAGQSRPSVRVFGALALLRLPALLREDALLDDLLNDNTLRFVLLPWLYREVFFEDPDLEKTLPSAGKIEALVRALFWTYVHGNNVPLLLCLISKFVEVLDATNLVDALELMDQYAERIHFPMPDESLKIPATTAIKSFAFYKLHELVSSLSVGTIAGFQEHGELIVRVLAALTPQMLSIAETTKGFRPWSSLAGHLSALYSLARIDGTVNVQEERAYGNLVLRRPACGAAQESEYLRLHLPLVQHVPFFQKYLDQQFAVEVIDAADIVASVDAFKSAQELDTQDRVQLLLDLLQFCYSGKLTLISDDSVRLVTNLRFLIHLAFYLGLQDTDMGKLLLAFCDEKLAAYGSTLDGLITSIIEIYQQYDDISTPKHFPKTMATFRASLADSAGMLQLMQHERTGEVDLQLIRSVTTIYCKSMEQKLVASQNQASNYRSLYSQAQFQTTQESLLAQSLQHKVDNQRAQINNLQNALRRSRQ